MKEKTGTIIAYCIGGAMTFALLGGYGYLIDAKDKAEDAKKVACVSIVSEAYSNSEEGRLAAENVCINPCMWQSIDELVNDYGLTEPSEIYQAAKRKCEYTLPK